MTNAMVVLACDSAAKAVEARQFLIQNGYPEAQITAEQVAVFNYNAATYDGGTSEGLTGKFIVIGRK